MNKPENVKLEVYKFKLNPRKTYKGTVSFRDLFIKQTGSANGVSNVDLFKDYFNFFITTLDTEYKIVKNKAFTLIGGNTDTGFSATSQIVYGVLEGGPLGEGKTRRTAADKTDTNASRAPS